MARRQAVLVLAADASPLIGSGHVLRSLALAESWMLRGGRAVLVSDDLPASLERRVRASGAHLVPRARPRRSLGEQAADLGASWVSIDGYDTTTEDQEGVLAAGARLLVIDDHGTVGTYLGEVVLDQNFGAVADRYARRPEGSTLLLGPRYALLRGEFRRFRGRRRVVGDVARILVTFGGAPRLDTLLLVLDGLGPVTQCGARVVIAPGGISSDELAGSVQHLADVVEVLDGGSDVADAMAAADLAVAAAGSTVWELAMLGVPAVVVSVADNQRPLASALQARGIVVDLGWEDGLSASTVRGVVDELVRDRDRRASMVEAGQRLVDGYGADRTTMTLKLKTTRSRIVRPADSELLWTWANDPDTRRSAFSIEPIPRPDHERWFSARLADARCRIYLVEDEADPVGQIRFDAKGHRAGADIDVTVAPERRGQGMGPIVIRSGCTQYFADEPTVQALHAAVKVANRASRRSFEFAGFEDLGDAVEGNVPVRRYVLRRGSL